jgi:hypothetical protein
VTTTTDQNSSKNNTKRIISSTLFIKSLLGNTFCFLLLLLSTQTPPSKIMNNIHSNSGGNQVESSAPMKSLNMPKSWSQYQAAGGESSPTSLFALTSAASAASAFDLQNFSRAMMFGSAFDTAPSFLLNNGVRQSTEDITAQVLEEISDDIFDDHDDAGGENPPPSNNNGSSSAFEPIPIFHQGTPSSQFPYHPQSQSLQHAGNHHQSRAGFLEDALSQTLNILSDDDFRLFDDNPTPNSAALRPQEQRSDVFAPITPSPNKRERSTSSPSKKGRDMEALPSPPSKKAKKQEATPASSSGGAMRRFRPYQAEQWSEKFQELLDFKQEKGHCCVPHTYQENPALARW